MQRQGERDRSQGRGIERRGAERHPAERYTAERRGAGRRGGADRADERGTRSDRLPRVPDDITADQLDAEARAELRTLPGDLAEAVARQLVAAGLAEDPERGYEHALAARTLAGRVGLVREACGVAAYRAGKWAEALTELRAARRLTGRGSYLPMMADCERALGRLDRALELVRGPQAEGLDRATQIELRIVESGIRRDQGLPEAAVAVLQVPELAGRPGRPGSARLFYAYADALAEAGREDEAQDWFGRAAAADPDGETDAAERFDELDFVVIDDLEDPGDPGDADDAQDGLDDAADLDDPVDFQDAADTGGPGGADKADDLEDAGDRAGTGARADARDSQDAGDPRDAADARDAADGQDAPDPGAGPAGGLPG
ncbi:MAG TPA: hypothetical protein VH637_06340 [Streptosporangiaceae bacterium]|jgi:tetratricopeptide (TPR) repeat protein